VLFRGLRAHLLTSCATLTLAFVVAAGAVAVAGASRAGHTPAAAAAMLALYGGVALAEQTARSTVGRSHDIALARLRGMTGARLVGFAAGPLLAVTLVGITVGSVVGVGLAGRIAHGWHASYSLGPREVVLALVLLLGAWLTVALVAASVIRRPLADALSVLTRRRGASWVTLFLEILVVAAAVLAVYEAHRGGHGWVPVIAPALVALAAGQVVAWLLALTPRVGRRLGVALTSRRLRRDPDPGSVVRILVAAAVLLAVTLTGGRAAAAWRDDAAHLRAGGPVVVPFSNGALRAYAATRDADPSGKWLMAAVSVDDLEPSHRRTFVDAERWPAVVGDYFSGTSAAAATARMTGLAVQTGPVLFQGPTVKVEAAGVAPGKPAVVSIAYVGDAGYPHTTRVRVAHDGETSTPLARCAVGCSLLTVSVKEGDVDVSHVAVGPTDLLSHPVSHRGPGATTAVSLGGSTQQAQQALTTPGIRLGSTVDSIDGTSPAVHVVGSVAAIPFLGRSGALLDLPGVLRGAVGTIPVAHAVVVARADTPASVLARLHHDGGGRATTYAEMQAAFAATPQARADRLALLVAIGIALVALTHLVAWLAAQVGRRRAEVAGLRVAGLRPRAVRRAYLVEAVVLAAVVLAAAVIAAAATMSTLLRPMKLVGGWADAPPLDLGLRPWTLAVVVLAVAAVTAASCVVVFTRFGRGARPSALRAAER
jgi:hypothetical protein